MAGGIGRAQGAYDEMVFRSMVRDGSQFYDPLGLVSEGTKIDFQVEVNSYLYGTRFMTYLAYAVLAGEADRVGRRAARAANATTPRSSRKSSASRSRRPGRSGSSWSTSSSRRTSRRSASTRSPPVQDLSDRGPGLGLAGLLRRRTRGQIYAAFNYPGVVAHMGAISIDDAASREDRRHQGPDDLHGRPRWPTTPRASTIFYTTDNSAYRDLRVLDPETGKIGDPAQGRPHRRPGLQSRPTARSGACATSTASRRWSGSPTPTTSGTRSTPGPTVT